MQFKLQVDFILDLKRENSLIDYIGRFENLETHWKEICHITENKYYPLPVKNSSDHKPWQYEYNNKMKAIVYKLFKRDFNYFNYPK